jgi:hypothetical protein
MARSRKLLGQEQRGPIKKICENEESSLIGQNKQASDQPRCGNYNDPMHPWSEYCLTIGFKGSS